MTTSVQSASVPALSDREIDLLRRQASGERQREIADSMLMTTSGVNSLSRRMMARLGARNLPHAVHLAHQFGLLDSLPDRQLPQPLVDVLELVADGCTNAEIARRLERSEYAVADQVREARRRLGARDRAQAAVLAVEAGLIRRRNRTS